LSGIARVLAPTEKQRIPRVHAANINLFNVQEKIQKLLSMGESLAPIICGVVHPCDEDSLKGALEAKRLGVIEPVIIAPEIKVRALAKNINIDLTNVKIIDVAHSHAAAEVAAEMAAQDQLEALMKGSLHTDELIHAVLMQPGLRTGRRLSHIFRFETMHYPKPLYITDAALNITPSLNDKVDIAQNAIDFYTLWE